MENLLSQITWWHWLVLALLVFGVEMMTGTFDLLMVSIAGVLTAVFAAVVPAGWQTQFVVFAVVSIALIIASRYVFPGMRKASPEHPTLNKRMASLVGQRGEVTREISGGHGQVKIGDTVWGAEAAEGEGPLAVGDVVVVASTNANTAVVRKA
ncbi:MAG TPA: NfeD family protein [Hyphomonas sp.]|nr:NfeD family protein [Hyphomonas sp.]HRI99914.1 NfeD family protein [Hyphomonas sp.]